MPEILDILRREQQSYADLAAALIAKHGQPDQMPADAHRLYDEFRKRSNECRAHADYLDSDESHQPNYKHQMTGIVGAVPKDGLVPGSSGAGAQLFKAGAPEGCYSHPLPAEVKVLDVIDKGDVSELAILGALGCLVKAQAVPVDSREVEPYAKAIGETKDMLTTGSAGALVPTTIAAYIIDLMRSRVVVANLGARVVPMKSKVVNVPRLTGDVTAAFYSEGATLSASDATLDSVPLTAERLEAGPVKLSMELEEDSDPIGVGQVVANSIANAMALRIDYVALRGSGTPPEPRGIRNATGVTLYAPGTNGDLMTYDVLLALLRNVTTANADPSGFALTPGAALTLNGLKEATTNAYLAPPPIFERMNLAVETTTSIPINLTKGSGTALTEVYCGDFRQLLIGMRVALQIGVLRELYRAEGKVGVVGRMRVATAVEHGPAFSVATFVDD